MGARQVGKTTLAKEIAVTQKRPSLYLDLENPIDVRKLSDPFTFLTDNGDKCIIIDEVQTIPSLFSVLRSVIDQERSNGRFILLGSASPQLVKGVSESLAGRIAYRELAPISLGELSTNISRDKHWLRGGFPRSLLARSEAASAEWLDSFIRSYIERDLGELFGVALTKSIISRMLSMLMHNNGAIWNAEQIARSLGLTAPTVNRYLEFMEGAFILQRLPAFYTNIGKRLIKAPKIFIRDSGLLHRLANVRNMNALKGNPIVGASWEGYVIEQIFQLKNQGIDLYYYRTQGGAECDLVFVQGNTPIACAEIKISNAPTLSKGNYQSFEDLKTKKNFVIVPDAEEYRLHKQILVCNLKDFIEKHLSKIK